MATKILVDKLIAGGKFSESDRIALNSLTDATAEGLIGEVDDFSDVTLEEFIEAAPAHLKGKIGPVENKKKEEPKPEPKPVLNADGTPIAAPETDDDWLKKAPPGIRASITNAMAIEKTEKEKLIKVITSNKNNKFNPDYLLTQDIPFLTNVAAMAGGEAAPQQTGPPPMWLTGPAPVVNAAGAKEDKEPLKVPTMNFDTDESLSRGRRELSPAK